MTGLRVLLVACEPAGAATYRYRNENLADTLNRAGHQAEVVYIGQSRIRVAHDIVVLHRICAVPEGLAFARAARACGAALVYSTDDLVFDENAFPESGELWMRIRSFASSHAAMITEADAALVSTEYLAGEVKRLFGPRKPVFTLRNFLSDDLFRRSERAARFRIGKDENVITLGYLSGTATHDADMRLIAPYLSEFLYSRGKARLLIVGPLSIEGQLTTLEEHGKVFRHPFVPWADLPSLLARIDINLAPLETRHRFVQAKSEIKYLEAAAVGVPTIATPTAGFTEAVPENAIVFCSQPGDWLQNLEKLYEDAEYRKERAECAYLHTLTQGIAEVNVANVSETFQKIATVSRVHRRDSAEAARGILVNYPFAPPKYLAKALLRRLRI